MNIRHGFSLYDLHNLYERHFLRVVVACLGEAPTLYCPDEDPYAYGAESGGVREAVMALRTANRLRELLESRGALVFMSRTRDRAVCTKARISGIRDDIEGQTLGNNYLYSQNGGNPSNWRFISIHYNSTNDPCPNQLQVIRKR